ncbi:hypothetical protein TTHERM_00549560 (macronuclear) [Tetrahymena thermophila SB210]|uniref:Uncharacterized protein n=1 Tax=Tetrahymena thermophila (strain SB210) TaxID=312017 RepID=I7LTT3_TETTS|nr:hypothetical protein TTHERM_00549560 [Tetrahymena thermophila SB210]EAR86109.2 hypothetical protein TTHERM_00549560 [Tetrahymena thermophila SB210]|eukprot:XP_976704.2 hypothetical protein TTHERM_00549560 [Tetrahymena thermophila SB210]
MSLIFLAQEKIKQKTKKLIKLIENTIAYYPPVYKTCKNQQIFLGKIVSISKKQLNFQTIKPLINAPKLEEETIFYKKLKDTILVEAIYEVYAVDQVIDFIELSPNEELYVKFYNTHYDLNKEYESQQSEHWFQLIPKQVLHPLKQTLQYIPSIILSIRACQAISRQRAVASKTTLITVQAISAAYEYSCILAWLTRVIPIQILSSRTCQAISSQRAVTSKTTQITVQAISTAYEYSCILT